MFLLTYDLNLEINKTKMKNDLYIYLNNDDNDDIFIDYINDFISFYEQLYIIIKLFENEISDINYNLVFEIDTTSYKPSIQLNSINIIKNDNIIITNIKNQLKKNDYDNIFSLLDTNYFFEINIDPYYIIKIVRTNEYIQFDNFYIGRILTLNHIQHDKTIEIHFDTKIYYIYDSETNISSYKFIIDKNIIILYNGPYIKIEKVQDYIKIDDELYYIDNKYTNINIDNYFTYLQI